MDVAKFESLLWTDEGTTIDFKRDQYKFAKATNDEKSELLKDILGFANAWRQGESFILIGVQEMLGGRANVFGIPDTEHLADHSLQQFVHALTNKQLTLAYETLVYEGKHVGIIRIERQRRPFFLKTNYGILTKHEVYVRRGSSTNPKQPAGPDEIYQMGEADSGGKDVATLSVVFAEVDRETVLGNEIDLQMMLRPIPDDKSMPDANPDNSYRQGYVTMPSPKVNTNYYRDFAKYHCFWSTYRLVRIAVRNAGQVVAQDVRVEMTVARTPNLFILDRLQTPEPPKQVNDFLNVPAFQKIKFKPLPAPGDFIIRDNPEFFTLKAGFGLIQPGRTVYSAPFCVGRGGSGPVVFDGHVYSNAPATSFSMTINFTVAFRQVNVQEIVEMARQFKIDGSSSVVKD